MDLTFVKNLRQINDDDERIVTLTLLIDIITNLMQDRKNHRHHTLPNSYIQEMFERYQGAMQCIQLIGFKQIQGDYVFDQIMSNEKLQEVLKLLENELESKSVKCNTRELGIIDDDEKFGNRLISLDNLDIPSSFHQLIPFISTLKLVQSYEDKDLRRYILSSIIPLEDFQRKISKRKTSTDVNQRDLLLLELLRWFREDFFTWFNQPTCDRCKISMKFTEYTPPTREEREVGHAQRVEFYRCPTCSSEYRFPRYNSPRKLLETRTGRCGEAANLFTCLCRALSYRVRYIHDPTDHVWTEVYSEHEHRWLHCDACENLCDSPLVYEKGWKKNLSFCIGFAFDHVQDVTWRYVTDFKQTRQRRNINEKHLVKVIHRINRTIQSQIEPQENKQTIGTQIEDIVSMLQEQTMTKESELHGRQSGSLAWKLSRGEIDQQDDITNGYVYSITNEESSKGLFSIEYNSVKDQYFRNGIEEVKQEGWLDRVNSCLNMQRKIEKDWKMVYLSRKQLNASGVISWMIQLPENLYRFQKINIQCPTTTFDEHAKIICQLQIGDQLIIDLPQNSNTSFEYIFEENIPVDRITFKITLTSSNDNSDDNAWQKAQLFRQSITEENHSHYLQIDLTILKR